MQDDATTNLRTSARDPAGTAPLRQRALGIIAFATLLALLYYGRAVLLPLTLALMLSLLIAPLVRSLRRLGLGQTIAVLVAVLACALACLSAAALLGTQVLRLATSLPQYEHTIQLKLHQLDQLTVGRLDALMREAGRVIESHGAERASGAPQTGEPTLSPSLTAVPVEVHQPSASPLQILSRLLATLWPPIETAGIVLVVLVFVLLEHETLRDRCIRLAGSTNIRLTTLALNDAGERLSSFFVSQFAVNLGVGAAIALGVALLGLPNAALWGTLAAVLRFVPYVGVWLAALLATTLTLAVVPGWSLAISVLGIFTLVELIAGQVVEPNLYGHATGLSPLTVVVAAIFWSALWGPMGLILSTPLTLCVLVLGRHFKALSFLELLLGDSPALTPPQRLYQRVLSGDTVDLIAGARAYLKRHSFAEYCDDVLLPALHLAAIDLAAGVITQDQQQKMRLTVVDLVSELAGEKLTRLQRTRRSSVLYNVSPGALLRQEREQRMGRWQGPLQVPRGSIMLCIGLALSPHVLAAELLVRALRQQKLDARHISSEDLEASPPPGADPSSVAVAYVVSAFPGMGQAECAQLCARLHRAFPGALVVAVLLPGLSSEPAPEVSVPGADDTVTSFGEAIQIGLERQQHPLAAASAP